MEVEKKERDELGEGKAGKVIAKRRRKSKGREGDWMGISNCGGLLFHNWLGG